MYVLGHIAARGGQHAGSELMVTDSFQFILRPADGEVTHVTDEQVLALSKGGYVDWLPGKPQVVADIIRQKRDSAAAMAAANASRAANDMAVAALDEEASISSRKAARTFVAIALSAVTLIAAAGAVALYLDRPAPPRKLPAYSPAGTEVARVETVPEWAAAGTASGRERAYFVGVPRATDQFVVRDFTESWMVVPGVSEMPIRLRPLAFQSEGFRQTKVVADGERSSTAAVYSDNAIPGRPELFSLYYLDTETMVSREIVQAMAVIEKAKAPADERRGSPEWWDAIGSYDISDKKVVLQARYNDGIPSARMGKVIWYDTNVFVSDGLEAVAKPVVVDAANAAFKSSPQVSKAGDKGWWVAFLEHPDSSDSTEGDGRLRVVRAYDDKTLSLASPANAFYVNSLTGRAAGTAQTSFDLVGDTVIFTEAGGTYSLDLSSVEFKPAGKANRKGVYPAYSVTSKKPTKVSVPKGARSVLVRDYLDRYFAVFLSGKKVSALPLAGGKEIVLSGTDAKKSSLESYRSHVLWVEPGDAEARIMEAAVSGEGDYGK